MCGFHSVASRRISPRSSWTGSGCTSCPIAVSVEMTSNSVRHGADVMSVPSSIFVRRHEVPMDEGDDAQLGPAHSATR